MSFQSKKEFICAQVLAQPIHMQEAVLRYKNHAFYNGVRECNDGFPDCSYKATRRDCDVPARQLIAKFRQQYDYEVYQRSLLVIAGAGVVQEVARSIVSSPEVAQGYIAKMKAMFN